jgi:hypothetical protein
MSVSFAKRNTDIFTICTGDKMIYKSRDHLLGWYEHMQSPGPALRPRVEQAKSTEIKDFENGDKTTVLSLPELDLPEGVWESGPGVYKAHCRSCERSYELCYDPQDFTEDANVCGGSDRCVR